MWSGDSLNVILWLGGVAIAAVLGSISTEAHRSRVILNWIAIVFGLLTVGWIVAPATSPFIAAIKPVINALVDSNALVTVVVVGIVALMMGRRDPLQPARDLADLGQEVGNQPKPPPFAARLQNQSEWVPDISLKDAVFYLGKESRWAVRPRSPDETKSFLTISLGNGRVTAWGKAHPDDDERFQIDPRFWEIAEITPETNYAFSRFVGGAAYDVQLSRREMEQVWPPKNPPAEA